jgi:hypothetical protein
MATAQASHARAISAKSTPILWWAGLGACFLALELYVFGSWIMSNKFVATPSGTDTLPFSGEVAKLIIQFGAPPLVLSGIVGFARSWIRHGKPPTIALFVIGWMMAYWQDPLINYVRPGFSYNSQYFNRGSWCDFVPGWLSPNGSRMPEPLLFACGAYMFVLPMTAGICTYAMRQAKRRWPGLNALQLILVAFATMFIADLWTEAWLVRTGVYAYMGSISSLSLWGGNWYQFPLYESVFGGACAAAVGSMYYFRDDKGNTLVERGLENISWKRGKTGLRALAIGGFVNLAVLSYTFCFIFLNLQLDAWPKGVPSYLRNGLCGVGTDYECPGPKVHIPLRSSGPLPPFTGRN